MSVKVHRVKQVYRGKLFNVAVETITLPNGITKEREVIRHPGAAAMVPLLEDGRVVLIRQYRHAVNEFLWEIPAGTLEPGESPEACAQRELVEEVGYEATNVDKLGEILPAPGYTDECIRIYLMQGLSQVGQQLEDDEIVEVHATGLSTALEMISRGEIRDAKTITGLLLTAARLNPNIPNP